MKKEIWRDIKNYEGYYQVSSFGKVKSLPRKGRLKEKILKQSNRVGYLSVSLCRGGNLKSRNVHQLVAIAFLDHTPNGYKGLIVDHKNNDRRDNRLENLQLINARQNTSKDRKGGSSSYVGVSWHKPTSRWIAHISINGKKRHLGLFTDELEASEAYQSALNEI